MNKFASRSGTIMLPKFQLRYGKKLNGALEAMGMGVAFRGEADFSGMVSAQLSLNAG